MINNDKIFATEMNVYACSQGLFGPDEGVETVGDFQLGDCNNGHEDPDLDKAEESNENLIFTIDDECYKLKEFENGKYNILFVTGFSGSGKTTLGGELSKKYHCSLIQLDDIMTPDLFTDSDFNKIDPIVCEFFKENEYAKLHRKEHKCYDLAEEFINYIMNKQLSHKIIVEGVQIWLSLNDKDNIINYEKLKTYPIIFKGTAGITSTIRALKRDKKKRTMYKIAHKYTYLFTDNLKIEKLRNMIKSEYCKK